MWVIKKRSHIGVITFMLFIAGAHSQFTYYTWGSRDGVYCINRIRHAT